MTRAIRSLLLLCVAALGPSCVLPVSSSRDAHGERDSGADQRAVPDLALDRAPDRLVIGPADTAEAGVDAGAGADAGEDAMTNGS